jgi:hypothetical protein
VIIEKNAKITKGTNGENSSNLVTLACDISHDVLRPNVSEKIEEQCDKRTFFSGHAKHVLARMQGDQIGDFSPHGR